MDFIKVISTVAPWIAGALGGPIGALAVEAAANALGLTDKTTDSLKQAISGVTPEQMLALKQADQAFALQMQELGFRQVADLEALAVNDRKDARAMQVETKSWVPAALSVIITLGFLSMLTGMMTGFLKAEDNQAMLLMLGALGVAFGQVINFWLGSTASSAEKTRIIALAQGK